MPTIIGIIPARMASTRFPGKPLRPIVGIPMLGHVLLRCQRAPTLAATFVATCDAEIADYVAALGGQVIMTGSHHERCGDRVAEALLPAEQALGRRADIVVLIQGDEPLVRPEMIDEAVAPLLADETIQITNLMGEIRTVEEWLDPNEVKVVVDHDGFALYFSREPIPSGQKWGGPVPRRKQVCIIPQRRDFLLQFSRLPPTPLECIESIDMLRVLEHGYRVKMVPTRFDVYSVDTPADLERVAALMPADPLFAEYGQVAGGVL